MSIQPGEHQRPPDGSKPREPGDPQAVSFIQGSESIPPTGSYYVNDYPYSHPVEIDFICLGTILLLVALYQIWQRVIAKKIRSPLLDKIHHKIGRARPLLVALAFFLILEAVLAVAVRIHPSSRYRPDPVSLWRINVEYTPGPGEGFSGVNSQGLVNDELPLEKPAGVVRIFSLGDSRTLGGAGTIPSDTYPHLLERSLGPLHKDAEIQVIQGAQLGYTSFQGLLLFKNVGLKYHPDVVTVALGYLDMALTWAPDKDHISESYLLTLARGLLYKSNLFLLIRKNLLNITKYRRNNLNSNREFNRVSLESFEENITNLIALARAEDMQVVLIELPHNPYSFGPAKFRDLRYREALRQIAARYADSDDVFFLDVFEHFWAELGYDKSEHSGEFQSTGAIQRVSNYQQPEDIEKRNNRYFEDDCHMKPIGHRVVTEQLVDLFEEKKIIERAISQ